MHVSPERFDLDRADKNGVAAFKRYIWTNSEVCSHCFSRVRAIGDITEIHTDLHTHEVAAYYERTDAGSQEHTPFDTNKRYGTCFCTECGADTQPHHQDLPWERMREYAITLYEYTQTHTPLSLDREAFARELARLRLDVRETSGRESQVFAVAFARALTTTVATSGRTRERAADAATAD